MNWPWIPKDHPTSNPPVYVVYVRNSILEAAGFLEFTIAAPVSKIEIGPWTRIVLHGTIPPAEAQGFLAPRRIGYMADFILKKESDSPIYKVEKCRSAALRGYQFCTLADFEDMMDIV